MKGGKSPLGYTIVEVMIVLAVSGVMFLVAANFINGKQQKTSFSSGVNEMASRIQDVIEQVSDGAYSDIPFGCTTSGLALTISVDATKSQGTDPDCVFIGKLVHLSFNGDSSNYEVFSLAASRGSTTLGADVTPVVSLPIQPAGIDLTSQQTIPQNLSLTGTGVKITGKAGKYYGFGFTQSQGTAGDATGTYASGAQTVGLVYSTALKSSTADEGAAISSITGTVASAQGASFCLTDGSRYAKISVGNTSAADSNSQLDVKVKIYPTPC